MANYPKSCTIKWMGYASSENNGNISMDYSKGNLFMGILLSGTPIMGRACIISAHALNLEFKDGGKEVRLGIDGGNFGKTILMDVTPKNTYKGKSLDFAVTIAAATTSVIIAKVGW